MATVVARWGIHSREGGGDVDRGLEGPLLAAGPAVLVPRLSRPMNEPLRGSRCDAPCASLGGSRMEPVMVDTAALAGMPELEPGGDVGVGEAPTIARCFDMPAMVAAGGRPLLMGVPGRAARATLRP